MPLLSSAAACFHEQQGMHPATGEAEDGRRSLPYFCHRIECRYRDTRLPTISSPRRKHGEIAQWFSAQRIDTSTPEHKHTRCFSEQSLLENDFTNPSLTRPVIWIMTQVRFTTLPLHPRLARGMYQVGMCPTLIYSLGRIDGFHLGHLMDRMNGIHTMRIEC